MNRGLRLLALSFVLFMPTSLLLADDWHYPNANRIVALSDIHGAYDAFVTTLQNAGVVDEHVTWSGGDTHLVITGDLVDRGAESRRVMDLVMRLESEAPRAGGQVHLTLGNHEVMNIIGDLRYVADAEFAAFADEESAAEREKWYQVFRRSQPAGAEEKEIRSAFNEKAPPGFFGHRSAFGKDGAYAKWLLDKPFLIVVNDTAFVHGGMPPYVSEHGLAGVNDALRADWHEFLTARFALEDAEILSPIHGFKELPWILENIIEAKQFDDAHMAFAQTAARLAKSPLHGPKGPLWYRGSSTCNGLVEGDPLRAALSEVGALRVAIGHTTTTTRRVQQRIDGQVLEINTGILQSVYKGEGYALVIEGDAITVVGENGETGLSPIYPPRRVGDEDRSFDDDVLTDILTTGEVIDLSPGDDSWRLVRVASGDNAVFAYFNELAQPKASAPELAAYKLDRLLGLDMVPVTIRRDVDGQQGTLQFVPATTINERDLVATGKGSAPPCALDKQRSAMYVFDALIGNRARTPLSILYSTDDWQLILVGHDKSFGTSKRLPAYLAIADLDIGDQWRTVLRDLDDRTLRTELAGVLNKRQIAALAKRRDALISTRR